MKVRDNGRPAATLLAMLAVVVGLSGCGSSDARGDLTTTTPPTTSTAPATSATEVIDESDTTGTVISEADVADLEQQLDEIDQLLEGVDSDLAQD